MDLSRVKERNNEYFIEYIVKSGKEKGSRKRQYGQLKRCVICKKLFFALNFEIKRGRGRFCSGHCASSLDNNGMWKGGKKKDIDGYVFLKMPTHPYSDNHGYVKEHRLIVEGFINRYLKREEIVHHRNCIKFDNRVVNLMAFAGHQAHSRFEYGKEIKLEDIIFDGSKL